MSTTRIDSAELERLRAAEVNLVNLKRQHEQSFRVITAITPFLEQLALITAPPVNPGTTAGQPTPDGKNWQIGFAEMTVLIVPQEDQIHLVAPVGVSTPTGVFNLAKDGTLGASTQTMMLGYAERIKRAQSEGADPVANKVSLLGESFATA